MTFTDDDLKRLKDLTVKSDLDEEIAEDAALWILNSQSALVARLEAAEAVAPYATHYHYFECKSKTDKEETCTCGYMKKWNDWNKTAGR
jgi:hypothetical protein